jgi:UDP-hydrolysing UDP-N-acetyl-D-glucosamine 2-epimerase
MIKTIGIITVARSDYSIYRPLLQEIAARPDFDLRLLVSGAHLETDFGMTVEGIERDGFPVSARIKVLEKGDDSGDVARAMGRGVIAFGAHFSSNPLDMLVVLGDRFEMFAAALAAVPFNLPIVHLHGGELTEGAMDDRFRHAMTKISHLHGVSHEAYRRRILQMGEEPWRVVTCGLMALDGIKTSPRLSLGELHRRFKVDFRVPTLLVTLHPTTNEFQNSMEQVEVVLTAVRRIGMQTVFTMPNADMAGRLIRARILDFVSHYRLGICVENFGAEAYFSVLSYVTLMLGNSSSGLMEAPYFGLPVVNVGDRQKGRLRAGNVLDVPFCVMEIEHAVKKALSPDFRLMAGKTRNFFGSGQAAKRLLEFIASAPPRERLINKSFCDV